MLNTCFFFLGLLGCLFVCRTRARLRVLFKLLGDTLRKTFRAMGLPFAWYCIWNHWTIVCFHDIVFEIIETHCVFMWFHLKPLKNIVFFMLFHLKSSKNVVFSCYFIWHHWKPLCFHVISSEIIENHCVFMTFHLKPLKSIVFSYYFIWNHWKTLCFHAISFEIAWPHNIFQ